MECHDISTGSTSKIARNLEPFEMVLISVNDRFTFNPRQMTRGIVFTHAAFLPETNETVNNFYGERPDFNGPRQVCLPSDRVVKSYWEHLFVLIEEGAMSSWLTLRKRRELLYYISHRYSIAQCLAFLLPMHELTNSFRSMILNNCERVKSTDEFVALSGMCRTIFYRRFKEEFGMSIYRWLQLRRAHTVRVCAAKPQMSVRQLMEENNFSSPSNFIRFCRMYFECSPNELLRRVRQGLPLKIIGEDNFNGFLSEK